MLMVICSLFVILNVARSPTSCQFADQDSKFSVSPGAKNPPLYVTEHLMAGKSLDEIKKLSRVHLENDTSDTNSYSGFFTVDQECESNLFFWFFESKQRSSEKPLVVMFHGGPGHSFFSHVFGGNGPFLLVNGTIEISNASWTNDFNVLYVESPVGAGYSHTGWYSCYCSTIDQAADHLYDSVQQFYRLFPEHKGGHVYLAGESYAGKYVSTLATLIHTRNGLENVTFVDLKGLFVGGGLIDPENQFYWADFLYEHGVFNTTGRKYVEYLESAARASIKKGKYYTAQLYLTWIAVYMYKLGYWPPVDVRLNHSDYVHEDDQLFDFVTLADIRDALHVGNLPFQSGNAVRWHFRKDSLKSVSANLSAALEHYRVLLYGGEYDMLIPPVQVDKVIEALDWPDFSHYQNKTRKTWYVDGEHAGYRKSYKHLTRVEVNDSSHFIIRSHPKWLAELFKSFVKGKI